MISQFAPDEAFIPQVTHEKLNTIIDCAENIWLHIVSYETRKTRPRIYYRSPGMLFFASERKRTGKKKPVVSFPKKNGGCLLDIDILRWEVYEVGELVTPNAFGRSIESLGFSWLEAFMMSKCDVKMICSKFERWLPKFDMYYYTLYFKILFLALSKYSSLVLIFNTRIPMLLNEWHDYGFWLRTAPSAVMRHACIKYLSSGEATKLYSSNRGFNWKTLYFYRMPVDRVPKAVSSQKAGSWVKNLHYNTRIFVLKPQTLLVVEESKSTSASMDSWNGAKLY